MFLLRCVHVVYSLNCPDDTGFTGICFGAGGVMEWSNECFYTHRRSLISELCVFLVSVGHFVHDGRHSLSLFANKEDRGGNHFDF